MQRSNTPSIIKPYFNNKKMKVHIARKYTQQTSNEWLMFNLIASKILHFNLTFLF